VWLAACPSGHYMQQWWTSSLSIAPFVYCVQRAVHALDDKWAGGDLVDREAFLTVAVLMLIFSSGIKERWRYARERQLTLTETYDAPASIRGIRSDARTLTAVQAMHRAIQNFKRHHPSTRIVSRDRCDGYTNCVPESLLWLSFIDDNSHDQPIYWPLPVLTEKLYPNYWRRFWSDVDRNGPLIVESAPGPFRPTKTINGYMLLVAVATQTGYYWYVCAPEHPEAREPGEIRVRLDPPPPVPTPSAPVPTPPVAIAAANRDGASSTPPPRPVKTPTVADAIVERDAASSTRVPVEGRVRDDMQLPVDLRGTERPRVYTWPGDIDVPDQPATLEGLDPNMATRARTMTFDHGRWIFRGSADAPFSYVLSFEERVIAGGTCFFATGHLEEGGISIGLQAHATWTGLVNVVTPGPFAVILKPQPGRYRLVLANNVTTTWRDLVRQNGPVVGIWNLLTGARLPNAFEIDRAGWTSFGAGSASIPGR